MRNCALLCSAVMCAVLCKKQNTKELKNDLCTFLCFSDRSYSSQIEETDGFIFPDSHKNPIFYFFSVFFNSINCCVF